MPLGVLVFVAIVLLLLPLSLWQRVRSGGARRQAWPWLVTLNFWATLASTLGFALFATIASAWWPAAWLYAVIGWLAGVLLGVLGHALTRFESGPQALFYTPSTWLVALLTLMIAVWLVAGLVQLAGLGQWRALAGVRLAQSCRTAGDGSGAAGLRLDVCRAAAAQGAPSPALPGI
ncbi:DUF1453 domain-containing protein [Stenotrophomonas pictorum]|uniref:DUF1453 domain-containing protein n=1 Tax=Stenotrophomonas pictorum TaxID=86184 RepID=UPI00210D6BAC|nr:DUF1453 domain-containing protein [Stenotrophomonas pictorum]